MRIRVVDSELNDGEVQTLDLNDGTTVEQFWSLHKRRCNPADYVIRLDNQPADMRAVIRPNSRLHISRRKVDGAMPRPAQHKFQVSVQVRPYAKEAEIVDGKIQCGVDPQPKEILPITPIYASSSETARQQAIAKALLLEEVDGGANPMREEDFDWDTVEVLVEQFGNSGPSPCGDCY